MNEEQKKRLEEMGKDKRKHFQVLSTLTGVDSKLLIASYEEGHMTGAQDAWNLAVNDTTNKIIHQIQIRDAEIAELKTKIESMCYDHTVEYQITEAIRNERERIGNELLGSGWKEKTGWFSIWAKQINDILNPSEEGKDG